MRVGRHIGIPRSGRGTGGLPAFVRNNLVVYDSAFGVELNGSTVSDWANQGRGGSPYDLSQSTAADQPDYSGSDSDLGGRPSIGSTVVGQRLNGPTAASGLLTFLHDGTGVTVYEVYYHAANGTFGGVLQTRGGSGAGCILSWNSGDRCAMDVYNATTGVIFANSSVSPGGLHITCRRHATAESPQSDNRVGGALTETFTRSNLATPASGSQAIDTTILGSSTIPFGGKLAALILDDSYHSDTRASATFEHLLARYS